MKYTIDKEDKYTLITLNEEKLDSIKAPRLKSELVTLFQSGTTNLILDLKEVKYVDSSGLSSILVAHRLAGEANGQFIMTGLGEHVMKLIKISKLENVIGILPTVEEAVDAVFLGEIEKDLGKENGEQQ